MWGLFRYGEKSQDCSEDFTESSGWATYDAYLRELERERARCRAVDEAAWTDFHDGIPGPHQEGDQWSLFADQLLLRQAIEQQLYPRIAAIGDIAMDGRSSSGWTPLDDAGAEIPLYFSGTYTGYYCNITFSVSPLIAIYLDGSNLVIEGEIGEIRRSGTDVAECMFGMTTLFGGAFLPALNETVATVLSAVLYNYEFNAGLSDTTLGDEWQCTDDDGRLRCTTPIELPQLQAAGRPAPLGTLTLDHLSGVPEGLLAGGTLDVFASGPFEYEVSTEPFEFGMSDCCRNLWYAGMIRIDGIGHMCAEVQIIDDPLGAYTLVVDTQRMAGPPLFEPMGYLLGRSVCG